MMPPVADTARRWLSSLVRAVAPSVFWRRRFRIIQRQNQARYDVALVASLSDPDRLSVDVGASVGQLTIAMLPASRSVVAFEPRPKQARELTAMFNALGAAVQVEAVALSDHTGSATMRVVAGAPGRSTIDANNALTDLQDDNIVTIDVPVKRLDDLQLEDIGLLKIDVEGHELGVLRGAANTIARNRPNIVVESEERHHPGAVAAIVGLLGGLGYQGYFDRDGVRRPIEEFDPALHQDPANADGPEDDWASHNRYVHNFVFLPQG